MKRAIQLSKICLLLSLLTGIFFFASSAGGQLEGVRYLLMKGKPTAPEITCNSLPASDPNVCSGSGQCTATDTCVCDAGYSGALCQDTIGVTCNTIPALDPAVCSGVGTCLENPTTGQGACHCPTDRKGQFTHVGLDCEVPWEAECFGTMASMPGVCSARGQCVAQDTCVCDPGFHGALCQKTDGVTCNGVPHSDPSVCSGRGVCQYNDLCVCDANSLGENCEIAVNPVCPDGSADDPQVCGGVGTCVLHHFDASNNAIGICDCMPHFTGNECQVHGWFCYSADLITEQGLSGGCINGTCIGQERCDCEPHEPEWLGQRCDVAPDSWCGITYASDPMVCSGRGLCKDSQCLCPGNNYYGAECQFVRDCYGIDAFSEKVCSGNGRCQKGVSVSDGLCLCNPGYSGTQCEVGP